MNAMSMEKAGESVINARCCLTPDLPVFPLHQLRIAQPDLWRRGEERWVAIVEPVRVNAAC